MISLDQALQFRSSGGGAEDEVYSIQQQALIKLRTPSIFAAVAALQGDDH